MAKSPCKCKKTECEECPEWIFTFADLVMLMMGFFVILWVLKPPAGKNGSSDAEAVEAQKQLIHMEGEIRRAFDYQPDPNSTNLVDKDMLMPKQRGTKDGAENEHARETPPGTDHDPTAIRPGKQSIVGSRLMFDRGSLKITPETTQSLNETAEKIRGHNTIVLVKGHASLDDLPDTSSSQQRMDLSLRRAQAVADYLMSKGVAPEVLRVQGCSTFEPVRQRVYTTEGLADNRRVEIEWTSELLENRQDSTNTPTAPLDNKAAATPTPNTPPAAKADGSKTE